MCPVNKMCLPLFLGIVSASFQRYFSNTINFNGKHIRLNRFLVFKEEKKERKQEIIQENV